MDSQEARKAIARIHNGARQALGAIASPDLEMGGLLELLADVVEADVALVRSGEGHGEDEVLHLLDRVGAAAQDVPDDRCWRALATTSAMRSRADGEFTVLDQVEFMRASRPTV
jgi:hypothetical protein